MAGFLEHATRLGHTDLGSLDLRSLRRILTDTDNQDNAICRPYSPTGLFNYSPALKIGTVSSVIMELRQRVMWATRGSPLTNPFVRYELT